MKIIYVSWIFYIMPDSASQNRRKLQIKYQVRTSRNLGLTGVDSCVLAELTVIIEAEVTSMTELR